MKFKNFRINITIANIKEEIYLLNKTNVGLPYNSMNIWNNFTFQTLNSRIVLGDSLIAQDKIEEAIHIFNDSI